MLIEVINSTLVWTKNKTHQLLLKEGMKGTVVDRNDSNLSIIVFDSDPLEVEYLVPNNFIKFTNEIMEQEAI